MADYDSLTPGEVLADASVAEFIKELGLGIAKAQTALDENSVKQMEAFTRAREDLGDRTLLELGLMPAFYHYQHADVSVSLQLRLEVGKRDEFGFAANARFDSGGQSSSQSSSSETETASGTRSEMRQARLSYQASSQGALAVAGNQVTPTGEDPLARLRSLRDLLTAGDEVETVVFQRPTRELAITTDASPDRVVVTSRSVAFLRTPHANGLIAIHDNAATEYVLNGETTVSTSAQADLPAYAAHVEAQIDAAGGFSTTLHPPRPDDQPSFRVTFDTGEAEFQQDEHRRHLLELARAFAAMGTSLRIEGLTDRVGSAADNLLLGTARGQFVYDFLVENGVDPNNIQLATSRGEGRAGDADADDGVPDQDWRVTRIFTPGRDYYWLSLRSTGGATLSNVSPDRIASPGTQNGFVFLWATQPMNLSGNSVIIDGETFPLSGAAGGGQAVGTAEAHAHNLSVAINGTESLRASRLGHVVQVSRATDVFEVTLFSRSSRALSLTGSEGLTVTEQFTRTRSAQTESREGQNTTMAVGVTVDKRESRQFNMAVTGNSQISARLVSVPPPELFVEAIRALQSERRS
ncbi:MAG: OmpA family protein [Halomonas sp.]